MPPRAIFVMHATWPAQSTPESVVRSLVEQLLAVSLGSPALADALGSDAEQVPPYPGAEALMGSVWARRTCSGVGISGRPRTEFAVR